MFDFERCKVLVMEHFFKALVPYKKPEETHFFIQRWLDILQSYTETKNFVGFHPSLPILSRLVPKANAVLVTPTYYKKPHIGGGLVSIIPRYLYSVNLQHRNIYCDAGLEFLMLYLEMTGIKLVGFYKNVSYQEEEWIRQLREKFPDLKIYGSASITSFLRKANTHFISASWTRHSKLQSRRPAVPTDKIVKRATS
jgi:hypothetical protein